MKNTGNTRCVVRCIRLKFSCTERLLKSKLSVHSLINGICLVAVCYDCLVSKDTYRCVDDKAWVCKLGRITMVFVPAVSTFYISQKMGSAGTTLIGDVIESQFKAAYNPLLGAALSLVLMVMVLVCIAVMNRFSDEEEVATI